MAATDLGNKPQDQRTLREALAFSIYTQKLAAFSKPKDFHPRSAAKDAVVEADYLLEELSTNR